MALEMRPLNEGTGSVELVSVDCHWYLTEDRSRVVPEGHADARWLWAAPGDEVPHAEAVRLGAIRPAPEAGDGAEKDQDVKRQDAPVDKRRERATDKGR